MAWKVDSGKDVSSVFRGVTTPPRELLDEIHGRGWDVSKIDMKDGQVVVTLKNPYGEQIEKTGPNQETALGNALVALMRQETIRYQGRTASWSNTWEDKQPQIAKAYAEAPIYDPKAAGAWKELGQDSLARANAIANQIHVEYTDDPNPYQDVNEMAEDVKKNRHINVSRANADHPLWPLDQVLAYRLVHDVMGHAQAGGDWGWHGENGATAAHMPLLSPQAQRALFTEAIGQTAHNGFYRQLAPQKIAFLDDELEPVQQQENAPGHGGSHPSQTIVQGLIPEIPKVAASEEDNVDPNDGWESGVNPLPDNAYLWMKDPNGLDPLDHQGLKEAAGNLDSGWFNLHHPDGSADYDSQKQAVVNAFRAVLTAPRKSDRWNATNYQHIRHIPATVSDPLRYFDTLEAQRDAHNQARGLPAGIHNQAILPQLDLFKQWISGLYPDLDDAQVNEAARRQLFHMRAEEEERIASEDPGGQLSTMEIADAARQGLKKRLSIATKPRLDQKFDFGNERLFHDAASRVEADVVGPGTYGEFLASHMRPIAGASLNADSLLSAAREDVADHGGKGHHFRAQALGLIPGVGPKEISHAWMLLQPHTSELGIINPSIADALGHPPEETKDRDYFKLERQLAAGRDNAGYTHVPLGQFGWGLWDYKNLGPGIHRDQRPLHVTDPTPQEHINWDQQPVPNDGNWMEPYWWNSTEPARDEIGKQWDRAVAVNHPAEEIPFRTSSVERVPSFIHPDTGEEITGQPGQGLMAHIRQSLGLSTPDVWALDLQAEKQ
jgi:hypothetical protein